MFNERLKMLRTNKNMSQVEMAKKIGVAKSTYSLYESGKRQPDVERIKKISGALQISADELLEIDYKKEMILSAKEIRIIEKIRKLDKHGIEVINSVLELEIDRLKNKKETKTVYYLPEYDIPVSAGTGMPLDYSNCEIAELTEQPPKGASFIVTVSGDSMEPTYTDGDRLYISKDTVIDYGTIGLFMYMGDVYVKEYTPDGLVSHNSKYDIINKNEDIECIGKVLGKVMK